MDWGAVVGASATVVAAGIGGGVAIYLRRLDARNTAQHANAERSRQEMRAYVGERFDKLDGRMDDHIKWHMDKGVVV